ncbi:MAG TPA: DUF5615 family PIN-like protein [Gemmatimonadales bacterium]|nr:DUF5615 family PIN-like protein [Gemmatimonadales bacterium]
MVTPGRARGDALVRAPVERRHIARHPLYLDADLSPSVADIARGLGPDCVSAHQVDMAGVPDRDQLLHAGRARRVMVTRNRDDFLRLTLEFYHERLPHAGLLIVPGTLQPASRVAHALQRWALGTVSVPAYAVLWLKP